MCMLRFSLSWFRTPNLCQQLTMQECVSNRNQWWFVGISVVYIFSWCIKSHEISISTYSFYVYFINRLPSIAANILIITLFLIKTAGFCLTWNDNFSCHQVCRSWLLILCDMVLELECITELRQSLLHKTSNLVWNQWKPITCD